MTRTAYILTALLTSAAFSFGQSGRTYNYAHVRYAEGGATLQRALEPEAGEAAINVPVMPGDRLWTSSNGRVEVLFADGTVLQMDESTKVDFTAFGETAGAETLLRLWNGSIFLR
ncbi:MAG TPA: FecR domain-containing protein, partial [Vicinamibacteria bacterium]